MLTLRHFTSTQFGLASPEAEVSLQWADLETIEAPVRWRLSVLGMRPTCTLVFGFSRGRRCQIVPRRSLWTGRTQLVDFETALRQAILAAPAGVAISARARLMAGVEDRATPPLVGESAKANALIVEAESDYARLRFSEAARALNQARHLEPQNVGLLRLDARLAVDWERSGRFIEKRYLALFMHAPRDREAIGMLALLQALNDWPMSDVDQRYLEENALAHPELGLALGGYLRRRGQFSDAARVLEALRVQSPHSTVQDAASAELTLTRDQERRATARGWDAAARYFQAAWPAAVALGGVILAILAVRTFSRQHAPAAHPAMPPAVSSPDPITSIPTPSPGNEPVFKTDRFNFRSNGAAAEPPQVDSPTTNPVSSPDVKLTRAKELLLHATSEAALHQARELLQSAVDAKDPEAMTFYAVMCDQGLGGPVEVDAAEHYYRESVNAGDGAAEYFLFNLLKRESKVRPIDESPEELQNLIESSAAHSFPAAVEALNPVNAPEPPVYPGDDRWPADHPIVPYFQPHPKFPVAARFLGLSGQVRVDFVANSEGNPVNVYAISSTCKIFEKEAIAAVRQWRFIPAVYHGRKINSHLQVPIIFSLDAPAG